MIGSIDLSHLLFTAATLSDPSWQDQQTVTANTQASSLSIPFDYQVSQHRQTTATMDVAPYITVALFDSASQVDGILDELTKISAYERKWQAYLHDIGKFGGEISHDQITTARVVWRTITSLFGLAAPLAITQPTSEAALQMAWNRQNEYLDIEILPDCRVAWFYRNRITSSVDSSGEEPIDVKHIPPRFFKHLKRFLREV